MKSSITHLPQIKQDELKKIVATICDNCDDIEKIILFGSYARGNYKEAKDLKLDRKSGHISDYDILVVTAKKEIALDPTLWKKISEICHKLNLSADPRIITHDIEALNIKLAERQYFYRDAKKEGILLYDANNFKLADDRDLTPKEQQRIAKDHFNEWFESAKEFFEGFLFYLNRNSLKKAAFNLHQTTETAYKTLHLVFTNYCPNEHFLKSLSFKVEDFDNTFKTIFTKTTKEDEIRFKLLEYAYIGGRYDPRYYISKQDLEILAKDVQKLLELTEKICQEKINSFELIASSPKHFHQKSYPTIQNP
jgi:predicted nucleotidyltransferase/HEPN domain-containing protein